MDVDLLNCKNEVEKQILALDSKVLVEVTGIKSEIHQIHNAIDELVTLTRFRPVELVVYGGVAGVLMAALGAVMAKMLGWDG